MLCFAVVQKVPTPVYCVRRSLRTGNPKRSVHCLGTQILDGASQALLNIDAWRPSKGSGFGDISQCDFGFAGKVGLGDRLEAGLHEALDEGINFVDGMIGTGTDVEDTAVSFVFFERYEMEFVHVVDVDEVAALLAGAVDQRLFAAEHAKNEGTHDRRNDTAPILRRTIYVEITYHNDVDTIELTITFAKSSAAVFACCVNTNRFDLVFFRREGVDALVFGGGIGVDDFVNLGRS